MFWFLNLKKIKPVFYLSIFFLISVVWFGLPMADKINVNKDYNSIVNIDKHLKKYDTKVYEFKTFTPEIIWEYGKPIPVLTQKNKAKATSSNRFLILTGAYLSDSLKQVFSNYKTTNSLLQVSGNAKNHKMGSTRNSSFILPRVEANTGVVPPPPLK